MEVHLSFPYDRDVVSRLKKIPKDMREYRSISKTWVIDSSCLDYATAVLKDKFNVTLFKSVNVLINIKNEIVNVYVSTQDEQIGVFSCVGNGEMIVNFDSDFHQVYRISSNIGAVIPDHIFVEIQTSTKSNVEVGNGAKITGGKIIVNAYKINEL